MVAGVGGARRTSPLLLPARAGEERLRFTEFQAASAQGPARTFPALASGALSAWAQALQPLMWVKTPLHNPH